MEQRAKNDAGIGEMPKVTSDGPVDFKSSKILVMIILVGIALAIFAGSRSLKPSSQPVATEWTLQSILVAAAPTIITLGLVYFYVFRQLWAAKPATVQTNNNATALIECGRLDEAESLLKGIEKTVSGNVLVRTIVEWNLALIQAERGDFEGAKPRMQKVLSASWLAQEAYHSSRVMLTAGLAEHSVLNGQFDEASDLLAIVSKSEHPYQRGGVWRAQVLLAARKKDYGLAAHLAGEYWREADSAVATASRNRFRLVWALALQELDPAGNYDRIANLVAGVRPYWKGQFLPLVSNWPEMREFLIQQKLTDEFALE